ncbi:MAG: YaiI/YqxD family protein [Magnetococcales bacterium]|nr:YaiI/YqxD family protein [Magnetococcales bacterium]MBF0347520.1 YaiI/YqxD family protein [Magnetococcales bacterium]MBF0629619.1 YaiI/YqxD family protein [Magnetococcales bacterium]
MSIILYVDADACPVKEEIIRVAERHQLNVIMVSNQKMRLPRSPLVRMEVVAGGLDKADDWIAERIGPRDVAITADIPLAARCLERGARVIGPTGKPFDADSIGMALSMRDLNAHLRDTGAISGNNPGFEKKDRSRFLNALENTIQALKREKT